jgi:hypothetical protein
MLPSHIFPPPSSAKNKAWHLKRCFILMQKNGEGDRMETLKPINSKGF